MRGRTILASQLFRFGFLLLTVAFAWPCCFAQGASPLARRVGTMPQSRASASALLGQMTPWKKISAQTVSFADRSTGPGAARRMPTIANRPPRAVLLRDLTGAAEIQLPAKAGCRKVRLHIHFFRIGRNSRIPHHFSCTAGPWLHRESPASGRKGFSHRGQGARTMASAGHIRPRVDYVTRCPLGPC